MALNLSTLTSPATSADVLAEVLTTADFLEPVPVLRNLARGSQKGGDAKQDVALNQPKALPLIDGDGYLYCPVATSNYANVEDPIIPATADFDLSTEFIVAKFASGSGYSHILGQYQGGANGRIHFGFYDHQKRLYFFCGGDGTNPNVDIKTAVDAIVEGQRHTARVTRVGNTFTLYLDGVLQQTTTSGVATLQTVGTQIGWGNLRGLNGAIFSVTEGSNFNCDFTATNVRHNDTKFKCATGQVVTINKSGNDPSTIIKKPVLRFSDAANTGLRGLFNQTITDGYMFAAFSVLGDGGESSARVFSINSTGVEDYQNTGSVFSAIKGTNLSRYAAGVSWDTLHVGMSDDDNGDILHEIKIESNAQVSRVNNADEATRTTDISAVSAEGFNIGDGATSSTTSNAAIDLEFLALFPASITDAQADDVRKYINNRNNVFLRHDTDGYYFFDGAATTDGQVFSGSSSWLGRIVGSDNDDPFKYLSNGSINDRPTTDGYKITFADNSDHFLFNTPLSNGLAGWQIVGTSLGTFAYRVNANAVTELNLLGNLGNASYRKAGDLYGVILLPESATGKDIEDARKLLIDRGAADGTTASSLNLYFVDRSDIVEFKTINFSSATSLRYTWHNMDSLPSFPSLDLTNAVDVTDAWSHSSSISSFGTTEIPNCTNFTSAWQSCSALTSFPAGAKLGTEANNVNFQDAWRQSGLTSFNTPLPTATGFTRAWFASSLTSFDLDILPEGIAFSATWQQTNLSSFHTKLPKAISLEYAWYNNPLLTEFKVESFPECVNNYWSWRNCNLTSFSTSLPKTRQVSEAWRNNSNLTDFSAEVFANWNPSVISTYVFHDTWVGCVNLTAQSVENILTSIAASGKYATSTGASGGSALADAGIDIDYNTATGSLSAATNAAIRSLDTKGWEVYINGEIRTGVELLDLQGFYFFESEGLAAANVTSWDSSIGASTASLDLVGTQTDGNDQPVADGTVVTFAGNSDHIDITSTPQAGWQVVGTSLGTFAYRVDNDAVTELNLLGNANTGATPYRQTGDLYGVILLPESATGADIEEARKLLIDRGAADGVTASSVENYFRERDDMVEFKGVSFSGVTNFVAVFFGSEALTTFDVNSLPDVTSLAYAFRETGLTSFHTQLPLVTNFSNSFYGSNLESFGVQLPEATRLDYAFFNCQSLSDFTTTDIKKCESFSSAWRDCSSLTSFPSDALLGTSANNVDFQGSWWDSGLTSFSTPLPTAGNCFAAFYNSDLETFNTSLPSATNLSHTWGNCSSLSDFSANVFDNWNPSSIGITVFNNAWVNCTSLTAQSVENILTSIDASGHYATTNKVSGGPALADAGIDIDYNVSTGSLSAATNAAIDSLSGKGWQVIINNVNLSLNNTYSVAFDGTDDYMSMTLPVLGNTHTLSAWFKTTASYGGAGSEGTLISYISSGGGDDDSVLAVFSNKVGWSDFVDDNQFGTSTVNDGNWHHAVAVVTATTQKIYVDGVLETTTTNSYSAGTNFSSATIGRRASASQRFFNGNIDEVAIWNSELSATDVTAIYNGGRPVNLNVNTNGYDNSSTLVAWWRMGDDGLGNAVPDQTNLTVGSDVVVNGDFSSSSGWNLGGSDTITGGKLVLVNSGGLRYRSLDLVDGQVYECKVTVSNYTSGSFRFYLNGGQGINIDSNGEHTQYITAGTANNLFGFNPAAASASLDNFSVTPINGYAGSLHNGPTFQTNTP